MDVMVAPRLGLRKMHVLDRFKVRLEGEVPQVVRERKSSGFVNSAAMGSASR